MSLVGTLDCLGVDAATFCNKAVCAVRAICGRSWGEQILKSIKCQVEKKQTSS